MTHFLVLLPLTVLTLLADDDARSVWQAGYFDDPAGLLRLMADFNRTELPITAAALDRLIVQLGNEDFDAREQASRELAALGRPVLPRLRRLTGHSDAEVARRALLAIEEIEGKIDPATVRAAARLLVRRKIPGAAAALLAYLPETDAETMEEVLTGLVTLGRVDGKLAPALQAALADPRADRRAAAALTLGCQSRTTEERALLARALADREPIVRLRAAQGLLAARDDAAVPVLIDLLRGGLEIAWQAEELLCWLAGPHAHRPTLGKGSVLAREVCRASWADWWRASGRKIDWARVAADHRRPGLVLATDGGRVWMSGCDGRERWSLSAGGQIVDAQLLPGPRILVADSENSRVKEIDLSGKILWNHEFKGVENLLTCQRLPGGNTFIGTDEYLIEVAPNGRPVWTYRPPGGDALSDAYRCGNRIVAVEGRHLVEVTPGGGFHRLPTRLACEECRVLPCGKDYLVAAINLHRVIRVDAEARIIESVEASGVMSVDVLPGGTLLVASGGSVRVTCGDRPVRILETTSSGRVLQETITAGSVGEFMFRVPSRARSCLRLVRIGLDQPRPEGLNLESIANRIKGLKDPDLAVRRWSASAIGKFGSGGGEAIDALMDALADADNEVRQNSGTALVQIGSAAIGPLREALRSRPEKVRVQAAMVLGGFGTVAAPAVPELRAALMDAKAGVELRSESATALGCIRKGAAAAIPDLLTILNNDDIPVVIRTRSAQALGWIDQATPPVVGSLITALHDKRVQVTAADALASLGPSAGDAVPHLVKMLMTTPDDDIELRQSMAHALGYMGPAAAPAVPLLAALAKHPYEFRDVRMSSMVALDRLGDTARPALPVIAEVLLQPNLPESQARLAAVILSSHGEAGMPGLIAAVKAANPTTRQAVMVVGAQMGAAGKPLLPALREAAKDKDETISKLANRAIERIEDNAKKP